MCTCVDGFVKLLVKWNEQHPAQTETKIPKFNEYIHSCLSWNAFDGTYFPTNETILICCCHNCQVNMRTRVVFFLNTLYKCSLYISWKFVFQRRPLSFVFGLLFTHITSTFHATPLFTRTQIRSRWVGETSSKYLHKVLLFSFLSIIAFLFQYDQKKIL